MRRFPLTRKPCVAEQLLPELVRQLEQLQQTGIMVRRGLYDLHVTHAQAAHLVETTVDVARQLVEAASAAGRLTPHTQAALSHLAQAYLHQMLAMTEERDAESIQELMRRLNNQGGRYGSE